MLATTGLCHEVLCLLSYSNIDQCCHPISKGHRLSDHYLTVANQPHPFWPGICTNKKHKVVYLKRGHSDAQSGSSKQMNLQHKQTIIFPTGHAN